MSSRFQSVMSVTVFTISTFLGAALLFQMEPLFGKLLLPWYGGAPAVWNSCVFFFQLLLLAGYLYAHILHRYFSIRWQLAMHSVVTIATLWTLPIRFEIAGLSGPAAHPIISVLTDLTLTVGLVFFVVSTTAPLLQAWYAAARPNESPYLLYVASNAGSLIGLLAYPTVIEFWLPLSTQLKVIGYSFYALAILFAACGLLAIRGPSVAAVSAGPEAINDPIVTGMTRWHWFLLAMCPSSLMLGVTTYLSTSIASMPAIWILPLSLYLLSFIIAFAQPPLWVILGSVAGYVMLAIMAALCEVLQVSSANLKLLLHCGLLLCGALAMHGALSRKRPAVKYLTEFYLWVSLGGLFGSIFNTLIAPALFNTLAEYPLAIAFGLCLLPIPVLGNRSGRTWVWGLRLTVTCAVLVGLSWNIYFSRLARSTVHRERTFFGEFHIVSSNPLPGQGVVHQLTHGDILHGMQFVSDDNQVRRPPLTYYFVSGPIGQLFAAYREAPISRNVAVVGEGVGSLAAYGESGDDYTFFEIDPAIDRVAQDSSFFTFVHDARQRGTSIRVVIGDARLRLRESPDLAFGLLILDAFTSDAIPVHLLTREAVAEYFSKLQPRGVLACHISNRFVDLEPVLGNIAASLGYTAMIQRDDHISDEDRRIGKQESVWLVMAATPADLRPLEKEGRWRVCRTKRELGIWTDDQSNLLSVVRWNN